MATGLARMVGWAGGDADDASRARILEGLASFGAAGAAGNPPAAPIALAGAVHAEGRHADTHAGAGCSVVLVGRGYWRSSAGKERTGATASAIAAAFGERGDRLLDDLEGHFSLAIVDPRGRRGLLAIDRMGVGTLAYAQPGAGEVIFGTRASLVAAHPVVGRELDPQAIFNYLFFHVVPAPRTIFKAVRKLGPGECLVWNGDGWQHKRYWEMQYSDRALEDPRAQQEEFRRALRDVVGRAASERNIGTFLSGGTDSSTVTGVLAELRGERVPAYSIGFRAEGFDEVHYARIAAQRYRVDHRIYYVTPDDVAESAARLAASFDEPFGNASALPAFYCAQRARQDGIETLLAGDGGDELFGGNARYAKQKVFQAYGRLPAALRSGLIDPLLAVDGRDFGFTPLRKAQSYVRQARIPLPDRLESYNFLMRAPIGEVLEPGFVSAIDPGEPLALMRDVYGRTRSAADVNRMMHLDLTFTLADSDLRKVVGACALADTGVEFPLLDDQMVEFSGRVSPADKVRGLKLRYFFKEALRDFLPREILEKEKHGFGLPFGVWLNEHRGLAELARGALDRFGRRGIVQPRFIAHLEAQQQSPYAGYFGVMIWVIMLLEIWLETLGEPVAPRLG